MPPLLIIASIAMVLASCGSSVPASQGKPDRSTTTSVSPSTTSAASVAGSGGSPLNGKGILAFDCAQYAHSDRLLLIDPTNGSTVASKSFDGNNYSPNCSAGREQFSSDFSLLAITLPNQPDGSKHVGYVQIATGQVTDVTGLTTSSSFSASVPDDTSPVFDPSNSDFYFLRGSGGTCDVYRFAVTTHQASDLGSINCSHTGAISIQQSHIVDPDLATFSPNGLIAMEDNCSASGEALYFAHATASMGFFDPSGVDFPTISSGAGPGVTEVTFGSGSFNCPTFYDWVGNDAVLFGGGDYSQFDLIQLPASLSGSVTPTTVLPQNQRSSNNAVVSPDGNSFAFLSTLGSVVTLYRSTFATGATPTSIGTPDASLQLLRWQ